MSALEVLTFIIMPPLAYLGAKWIVAPSPDWVALRACWRAIVGCLSR